MKPERVEAMIEALGNCVDISEGDPWCPRKAIGQFYDGLDMPECDECLVYGHDDFDGKCTCCWRAFAEGEPMLVEEMNATLREWEGDDA